MARRKKKESKLVTMIKKLNKVDDVDTIDIDQDEEDLQEEFMSTLEKLDDDIRVGVIDRRCRWAFPLAYALTAVALGAFFIALY